MKKKIIISGINGFLGNKLLHTFRDVYDVYGIAKQESCADDIKVFSSKNIDEIDFEPDYLILCHAAISSGNTIESNALLYEINVGLTERMTLKFQKTKIIYVSSASIYDTQSGVIGMNTVNNPITEYAISKLWGEKVVLKKNNAVIVRLSSLFGSGMKENTIIPNYVNHAIKSNIIPVWGNGERKQNYIFVEDVCCLIDSVMQNFDKVKNQILLAVNDKEYTNLEVANIVANETQSSIEFVNQDKSISLQYNNFETCNLLSWSVTTDFKEEIINYIKWKKKQYL